MVLPHCLRILIGSPNHIALDRHYLVWASSSGWSLPDNMDGKRQVGRLPLVDGARKALGFLSVFLGDGIQAEPLALQLLSVYWQNE